MTGHGLPGLDQSRVEAAVLAFDAARAADPTASPGAFLPGGPERLPALSGMARASLERAWLHSPPAGTAGEEDRRLSPAWVEYYLARHPELADCPAAVLDLVSAEHACRPGVPVEEYYARFPDRADDLRRRLGSAPPSIPGFDLLDRLGRGATGVVYRARQPRLDRDVAIKVLIAGAHADAADRARLLREARATAGLNHPNVVKLYDSGEVDGTPYLVFEYCPGRSLKDRLDQRSLPAREAAQLVATLARAVQAAHDRQVIHRDLKPANVLFAADGTPRVSDFGLARAAGESAGLTPLGAAVGTPAYAAPEQAGRARPVGPAADVFSLGAILYQCLTGRLPFVGATVAAVARAVQEDDPPPPRQLDRSIPADLETICLKCLEKDPARRYGSARALANDLERFLAGESIQARSPGTVERLARWCRRKPTLAALLGGLLVALAVCAWLLVRSEAHRQGEAAARAEAEAHFARSRDLVREFSQGIAGPDATPARVRQAQRDLMAHTAAFYETLERLRPTPDLVLDRADLYVRLGELFGRAGPTVESLAWVDRCEALARHPTLAHLADPRHRIQLANTLERLGHLQATNAANNSHAIDHLRRAIALREPAAQAGDRHARLANYTTRRALAGFLYHQRHDAQVLELLQASLRDLRAEATVPDGAVRDEFLETLPFLANVHLRVGKRDEAIRCWREYHAIAGRPELEDQLQPRFLLELVSSGLRLAELGVAAPRKADYPRLCDRGIAELEGQRKDDPYHPALLTGLGNAYLVLAAVRVDAGDLPGAVRAGRCMVPLLEEYLGRNPGDNPARLRLVDGRASLARTAAQAGEPALARESSRTAVDQAVDLLRRFGDDPAVRTWASVSVSNATAAIRQAGCHGEADVLTREVIRLLTDLAEREPDERSWRVGLAEAWTQAGKTHWAARRHGEAEEALRNAVRVTRAVWRRWPDQGAILADRVGRLGRFLEERGRFAAALDCLDERRDLLGDAPIARQALAREYRDRASALPPAEVALRERCETAIRQLTAPRDG